MKHFHSTCQGFSHIKADKVCQDASFSEGTGSMTMAIVCDGHGGSHYFRSDVGAQMAVEATKQCVVSFIANVDDGLIAGKSYTAKQAISSEALSSKLTKDTQTDKAFRQLFSSIIYRWRIKIEEHAKVNPITEKERQNIDTKFLDELQSGEGIEKTYGCTLICCVVMPQYWFAFQIGDGKCIAFNPAGEWSEPIPWDERCFLNKTTSLCDSSAIDEFRYCYCGDTSHPLAVFLGSDGIDDSFGETENMVNFYIQVLKLFNKDTEEDIDKDMTDTLSQLSQIGSKDDMSIACIYDEVMLRDNIQHLITWQKKQVEEDLYNINQQILRLREKIYILQHDNTSDEKSLIDYQYLQKDLQKSYEHKKSLANKRYIFAKELTPYKGITFNDNADMKIQESNESKI